MLKQTLLSLTLATFLTTGLYAEDKTAAAADTEAAATATASENVTTAPAADTSAPATATTSDVKHEGTTETTAAAGKKKGKKSHKGAKHCSKSTVDRKSAADATNALNREVKTATTKEMPMEAAAHKEATTNVDAATTTAEAATTATAS